MILTSVFSSSKNRAEVLLHRVGFQHFSVFWQSQKGSGSWHKGRDPEAKCFSQFRKIGQGFPCTRQVSQICSVFFSAISKRESGSRRSFSTSVFIQLKNRAGVFLRTAGFSNLFNAFDNSNSLEKETLVETKNKLEQPFLAHFFSKFFSKIRGYQY